MKRTDYKGDGSEGLWDIPGGSVDFGEDVNSAVKREVLEELNVKLKDARVFHIDSGKGFPSGNETENNVYFVFSLFVSKDYDLENGIKLSLEHSEFKWIGVDEICDYDFYLKKERVLVIKNYLKSL